MPTTEPRLRKLQTPNSISRQLDAKPSVYCSAPHLPQVYRCTFKNKSSVYLSWTQTGLNDERADPSALESPPSPECDSKQSSCQLSSVHGAGASGMRNSSSAFKYIWCEPTWSLWHHISPWGKVLLAPESHIPRVCPSLGGR